MVIWSESLDRIVPLCQDFEERLIKLLWRSRPAAGAPPSSYSYADSSSATPSVAEHGSADGLRISRAGNNASRASVNRIGQRRGLYGEQGREYEEEDAPDAEKIAAAGGAAGAAIGGVHAAKRFKRTWYGKKVALPVPVMDDSGADLENFGGEEVRPVKMYAPLYNGLACGLALVFAGAALKTLLVEWMLDGSFIRFALCVVIPLLFCVSLVRVGWSLFPSIHFY